MRRDEMGSIPTQYISDFKVLVATIFVQCSFTCVGTNLKGTNEVIDLLKR